MKKEAKASSNSLMKGFVDQVLEKEGTKGQLKEKQKKELLTLLDIQSTQKRIENAIRMLRDHNVEWIDPEQNKARQTFARQLARELNAQPTEAHHHTFEEILCIPKAKIDTIYAVGAEYFEKKCFPEACDIFFFLTQLNPYYANIWIAMGLCWQNQEKYQEALGSYSIAILLNEKNCEPYGHSIECYLNLKEYDQAKAMIAFAGPLFEENSNVKVQLASFTHRLKKA